MLSLDKDLQSKKYSLEDFVELTERILQYLPNVISEYKDKDNYRIFSSKIAGTTKFVRPINTNIFIFKHIDFTKSFSELKTILLKIKQKSNISENERNIINSTIYTIQQSIGAGLDLLVNQNSARKHVGNRFEELIRVIFSEIGIANQKLVLQIPYETDEGIKTYKCENDLILSPYNKVKSTIKSLDKNEIVVSIKTTSKDRMGKIFIDKILLERFIGHDQKVIGIFLNDVQRKENNNISFTLVSGLFMVYSKFLTKLDGIYYLDPPPKTEKLPLSKYLKPFSTLICEDIEHLLTP